MDSEEKKFEKIRLRILKNKRITAFAILLIISFITILVSDIAVNSSKHKLKSFKLHFNKIEVAIPIEFAKENFPENNPYVIEKIQKELDKYSNAISTVKLLYLKSCFYFPDIEKQLAKNKIPDDFKYLAAVESGFQNNIFSKRGAAGIWQFIPETGKKYGLKVNESVDERLDINKSTLAACMYFKEAFKFLNSYILVAASYNIGINGLIKRIEKQNNSNYFELILKKETAVYLYKAMALKIILSDPEYFNIHIKNNQIVRRKVKTITLKDDLNLKALIESYFCELDEFIFYNSRFLPSLPLIINKNSEITVPSENKNFKKWNAIKILFQIPKIEEKEQSETQLLTTDTLH